MYAGHGTPETEKVAFNEKPIVSSIWTVVKGHAAVRGCQDFVRSIYDTQSDGSPLQDLSSGQGSIQEEKGVLLSNFMHSRLVLCLS